MTERESPFTRLDSKLISGLRHDSGPFIERLGEPQLDERGFSFSPGNEPFRKFIIGYGLNKKFLGKIYLMTLEGVLTVLVPVSVAGSLELGYRGFVRKGKPYFALKGSKDHGVLENRILAVLNNNQGLLESCRGLEVEFLKILFDPREGSARIRVRPYGGSLLRIMLPPLHYHVRLIPEQATLILKVMNQIGGILNQLLR
jgi:hypothetical protein